MLYFREKDPRSTSSRLAPCESERFQTAMYRFWSVCALYGRPAPVNRVARVESERHDKMLSDLGQMQTRFLYTFTLEEMVPLFQVWTFVLDLATWAVRAEFFPQKGS